MTREIVVAICMIMMVCWGLGLLAGYLVGINSRKVMTRSEAARIMAKASWRNR